MAEDQNRTNVDQYMLRFPPGMRGQLKDLAKANNRSMNGEIIAALDMWIKNSALYGIPPDTLDRLSAAFTRVLENDPEIGPLLKRNGEGQ